MKSEQTYPDELPHIDPIWMVWNDRVIARIAQGIWEESDWGRLPILADALEEAGCTDPVILNHLRSSHEKPYCSGCWQRTCWLVNHMLDRQQKVVARFKLPGHSDEDEAVVINQGENYGATYLVFVEDCFTPPLYVVEAETFSAVEDIFVDSSYGEAERLNPESDYDNDDYGFHLHVGDRIGGIEIQRDGWYDLRGHYLGDGADAARMEPQFTGSGNMYNDEAIRIHGGEVSRFELGDRMPFPVTYHGPGLPKEGISPLRYFRRTSCRHCDKAFYPDVPLSQWGREEFCSPACMNAAGW